MSNFPAKIELHKPNNRNSILEDIELVSSQ